MPRGASRKSSLTKIAQAPSGTGSMRLNEAGGSSKHNPYGTQHRVCRHVMIQTLSLSEAPLEKGRCFRDAVLRTVQTMASACSFTVSTSQG